MIMYNLLIFNFINKVMLRFLFKGLESSYLIALQQDSLFK